VGARLNHTIVWCRDSPRSAGFLAEMLGRPAPVPFGPFMVVELDNEVSLDYRSTDGTIASQHYAFLISEAEFDQAFARITGQGRGVYFPDPDGHLLEVITRPYGSGG
jgi:hypothetical protein